MKKADTIVCMNIVKQAPCASARMVHDKAAGTNKAHLHVHLADVEGSLEDARSFGHHELRTVQCLPPPWQGCITRVGRRIAGNNCLDT